MSSNTVDFCSCGVYTRSLWFKERDQEHETIRCNSKKGHELFQNCKGLLISITGNQQLKATANIEYEIARSSRPKAV